MMRPRAYSSPPSLKTSAEAGGPDRGWQAMPFADGLQYRASGTRIKVDINGRSLVATLRIPFLGVRSTANKPDRTPWSEAASTNVQAVISVNGDVDLRPPGLPRPSDALQSAREACERSAREANRIPDVSNLLVGEARKRAEEARDKALAILNAALEDV